MRSPPIDAGMNAVLRVEKKSAQGQPGCLIGTALRPRGSTGVEGRILLIVLFYKIKLNFEVIFFLLQFIKSQ